MSFPAQSTPRSDVELNACIILEVETRTGLRILMNLERRANGHSVFGFPGGKIDHGETPFQAACREFHEETDQPFDLSAWIEISKFTIGDTRFYRGRYTARLDLGPRSNREVEATELVRIQEFEAALLDPTHVITVGRYSGRLRKCCHITFQ